MYQLEIRSGGLLVSSVFAVFALAALISDGISRSHLDRRRSAVLLAVGGTGFEQGLFDVDGPSVLDLPRSAWAAGGRGTAAWMESRKALRVGKGTVQAKSREQGLYELYGPSLLDHSRSIRAAGRRETASWMGNKMASGKMGGRSRKEATVQLLAGEDGKWYSDLIGARSDYASAAESLGAGEFFPSISAVWLCLCIFCGWCIAKSENHDLHHSKGFDWVYLSRLDLVMYALCC